MKHGLMLILVLALAACSGEAQKTPRPDFREALDAHLAAIAARDIDAFKPTVSTRDDVHLVFPEGDVIETTEGFLGFHEEWFKDPNWRMEGEDMAAAYMKYNYRDKADDEPRAAWLLLLFQLEDGEWRLIHDHNTRIKKAPESE